jgi:hypothetical protein
MSPKPASQGSSVSIECASPGTQNPTLKTVTLCVRALFQWQSPKDKDNVDIATALKSVTPVNFASDSAMGHVAASSTKNFETKQTLTSAGATSERIRPTRMQELIRRCRECPVR